MTSSATKPKSTGVKKCSSVFLCFLFFFPCISLKQKTNPDILEGKQPPVVYLAKKFHASKHKHIPGGFHCVTLVSWESSAFASVTPSVASRHETKPSCACVLISRCPGWMWPFSDQC